MTKETKARLVVTKTKIKTKTKTKTKTGSLVRRRGGTLGNYHCGLPLQKELE